MAERIFLTEPIYPVPGLLLETKCTWAIVGEVAGISAAVSFETAHMFTAVIDGVEVKQWGDAFLYTHYGTSEKPPGIFLLGGEMHQCPVLEVPCWQANLMTSAPMLKYRWQAGGLDDEIIYAELEKLYESFAS